MYHSEKFVPDIENQKFVNINNLFQPRQLNAQFQHNLALFLFRPVLQPTTQIFERVSKYCTQAIIFSISIHHLLVSLDTFMVAYHSSCNFFYTLFSSSNLSATNKNNILISIDFWKYYVFFSLIWDDAKNCHIRVNLYAAKLRNYYPWQNMTFVLIACCFFPHFFSFRRVHRGYS